MSNENKNGDKVAPMGKPTMDRKVPEVQKQDTYVAPEQLVKQEPVIQRPSSNFATKVEEVEEKKTFEVDQITAFLDEYVLKINASQSDEETADIQVSLYQFLRRLARTPSQQEFRANWTKITNYFNRSESLSLVSVNKCTRFLNLDNKDQKAFSTLTYLIFTKCPKKVGYNPNPTMSVISNDALNDKIQHLGITTINNLTSYYNI